MVTSGQSQGNYYGCIVSKYKMYSSSVYIKHKYMLMTRTKNEERLIISSLLSILQCNLYYLLPVLYYCL